ncbi:glycoside hydrolase family 2 protein [Pontiella sulfatireligans]|uniref:Beta-galactosidase n=1 Tax=Pontiella sulfatireligans TaxID=2750658 RepID=A0A6C2UP64_9BACT|nr:glycoside hydrolase family 2 TIM barrel-domain containing protein [Pontiella sulfatireligans]VGO21988.1 Beta-galactosidase [Pontiella sulfatireligans]
MKKVLLAVIIGMAFSVQAGSISSGAVKINFQPANVETPAGWLADSGKLYSEARGYGWDKNLGTRERKKSSDKLFDTLAGVMHGQTEAIFMMDQPNGEYLLSVQLGDSGYSSDFSLFVQEGKTAVAAEKTLPGKFHVVKTLVTVKDGKLNVRFVRNGTPGVSINWLALEKKGSVDSALWTKLSGELKGKQAVAFAAFEESFDADTLSDGTWARFGRGEFAVRDGVLSVTDGWVAGGDPEWNSYAMEFRARAPQSARQVQIWAGVRHHNRDYRYVVALRGGNNNQVYLARYGAEGLDEILGVEPLDFTPAPGTWYTMKVVVAGTKIAVYLGDEKEPRILANDAGAPFKSGGISLGGSYLPTEFDWVKVSPVEPSALDSVSVRKADGLSAEEKAHKRVMQRAAYRPFYVPNLYKQRNEFSLAGDWLFIPEQEANGNVAAIDYDDSKAHVIDVPNFWVPFAAWLEGENINGTTMNKGQNDKLHRLEKKRCANYTFDALNTQSAWYRHAIDFPEDIGTKEVVLDFQAIGLISTIYFNGEKIQDHIGMFSPQKINVTDRVKPGRNVVAIQVWRQWKDELSDEVSATIDDNYAAAWNIIAEEKKGKLLDLGKSQRAEKLMDKHIPRAFFHGAPAGIWRDVTLMITDKVKVEDFYFKPALDGAEIDVTYANYSAKAQDLTLSYEIKNKVSGKLLCCGVVEQRNLAADETRNVTFNTPTVSPELWGPGTPNLYTISFKVTQNHDLLDRLTDQVGFRTIEVSGDQLLLNGKPFWVRGANHMPGHMRPYDEKLAKKFMQLALEHNVIATRTHACPYSDQWMDAADEIGVMVSFEGPYPWLMLRDTPSDEAIEIWKREMGALVKANRNRPSVFLWTMNNEMKFYMKDGTDEEITEKGRILTEGIDVVRKLDPTRPVIADSAYNRNHAKWTGRYERIIQKHNLDDGDIDDPHGYWNWYNESFFMFMKGEFGRTFHCPGRPMMGQELSTGYPRADDALPTRFYLFQHLTPQTTVGKDAYEESNPEIFIRRHSMLTKELVEMMRRVEHFQTCGLSVFAFHTWFYNNHEANKVAPMQTADRLRLAYEPVLASAELWGRHFYAGDTLATAVTLVNDSEGFASLENAKVIAQVVGDDGRVLASKEINYGSVDYYDAVKKPLEIRVPEKLGEARVDGKLVLRVFDGKKQLSKNEYEVILAERDWSFVKANRTVKRVVLGSDAKAQALLKRYGDEFQTVKSVAGIGKSKAVLVVCDAASVPDYKQIKTFVEQGGNALLLNNGQAVADLFPEQVKTYTPYRHEIVTMNRKSHPVFDGLEPLDVAWFSDETEVPYAATGRFGLDRLNNNVTAVAETLQWHGYIKGEGRNEKYRKIGGSPMFELNLGKGTVFVSELRTDAIEFDPIDGRVIANILNYDFGFNR